MIFHEVGLDVFKARSFILLKGDCLAVRDESLK
jgi:hypothetical protein